MNIDVDSVLDLAPEDFLAKRVAVLGTTGSGKSNTTGVLLEELLPHMPIAIIDPHGEYFTLREKFDILIVGKSDNVTLSIKANQAGDVARFCYQNRRSVILDLYRVTDRAERLRYVYNFCSALWWLARDLPLGTHQPYGVVLEEAHNFIPEGKVREAAFETLITFATEGRKFNLMVIASEQRAANIDKTFLGMCEFRFFHRVSDAPDVKAYADRLTWTAKQVKETVTALRTGQAVFRTPDVQAVIQVRPRLTRQITPNTQLDEGYKASLLDVDQGLIEALAEQLKTDASAAADASPDAVKPATNDVLLLQRTIDLQAATLQQQEADIARLTAEVERWRTAAGDRDQLLCEAREIVQMREGTIRKLERQLRKTAPAPGAQRLPLQFEDEDTEDTAVVMRERRTTVEREFVGARHSSRSIKIRVNRQERKLDKLIATLQRLEPRHRRLLAYCMDADTTITMQQAAAALDYSTNWLQRAAIALQNLGLLTRPQTWVWRSVVDGYAEREFADLDQQQVIERIWSVVE